MGSLLLMLLLHSAALQTEKAVVSGVVSLADGKPAVDVRVAAMAASRGGDTTGTPLISLTMTDQAGRYRLNDLEPGRYYIVAGRVDLPTYYPGVSNATDAVSVAVINGDDLSDFDFTVGDASTKLSESVPQPRTVALKGRIVFGHGSQGASLPASLKLTIARYMVWGGGNPAFIYSIRHVNQPTVGPDGGFQVSVAEGETTITAELPSGYFVKAMTIGARDLMKQRLNITTSAASAMPEIVITIETDPTGRQD